jgi:hypothetical protein
MLSYAASERIHQDKKVNNIYIYILIFILSHSVQDCTYNEIIIMWLGAFGLLLPELVPLEMFQKLFVAL